MSNSSLKLVPEVYSTHVAKAVQVYWQTLSSQKQRQGKKKKGKAASDKGARAAVTGGQQMNGFCDLVTWLLKHSGMPNASIFIKSQLELPGYFRPTKKWDMLIVHENRLVAAIEFKSQAGPSFGNNFNNRTEEALGTATDIWTAFREGAFGIRQQRPWLGWLMLLEDCTGSNSEIGVEEPHFEVFPEYHGASYAKRYELLLRKLMREKLYDGAAFLMADRRDGLRGVYSEPAPDLTIHGFLVGLAAHVRKTLESH